MSITLSQLLLIAPFSDDMKDILNKRLPHLSQREKEHLTNVCWKTLEYYISQKEIYLQDEPYMGEKGYPDRIPLLTVLEYIIKIKEAYPEADNYADEAAIEKELRSRLFPPMRRLKLW